MKIRKYRTIALTICIIVLYCAQLSFAAYISYPRPMGKEERIKVVNYVPNGVIHFTGYYYYQTIIEFDPSETIDTVLLGTQNLWQMHIVKNRIYIKPTADNAETNMTLITDKRIYFFTLQAAKASSINDERITFMLKILYPDDKMIDHIVHEAAYDLPNLNRKELYNFKYYVTGTAKHLEPSLILDDGEFTYFQFKGINNEIPAIFYIGPNAQETLVNYRSVGEYIIVEQVADQFVLRSGDDALTIWNSNIGDQNVRNLVMQKKQASKSRKKNRQMR